MNEMTKDLIRFGTLIYCPHCYIMQCKLKYWINSAPQWFSASTPQIGK